MTSMQNNTIATDIIDCDVFVIGGGPAGSTVAAQLAQKGHRVALADKDQHPRFHIGESLLPMNMPLFEKMGIADKIAAIGMKKHGAEFLSQYHEKTSSKFYFGEAVDQTYPTAWQVRRSDFDLVLIENAAKQGVQVTQNCRIKEVDTDSKGVNIMGVDKEGNKKQWRAKFVVDASGRDTFFGNQLGIKDKNERHNSAAVYAHFHNVPRSEGIDAGNVVLSWFKHGWFWMIPLIDGTMSVGAVCWPYYLKSRQTDVNTFFMDTIKMCPPVAKLLENATLASEVTATGNYTYKCSSMVGDRHLLVGDAFAFIDPVFSSGVYLAMQGAFFASDTLDAALRNPNRRAIYFRTYEKKIQRGIKDFSWFIYRMTTPAIRDLFMYPRNVLGVQSGVLSMLAGDVFRNNGVRSRLAIFKIIYYVKSMLIPTRSWQAMMMRRKSIKHIADLPTTAQS